MTKAKRWKPKYGELYFNVNTMCGVNSWGWWDDEEDKDAFRLGNCFKTKREAEAVARKQKGFWKGVREGKGNEE